MKKKAVFIVSLVGACLVGGGATYLALASGRDNVSEYPEIIEKIVEVPAYPGAHFTSYQSSGYPDLTYAAENAVQAVVNIEVTQKVAARGGYDPILEFFGIPQGYSQRDGAMREQKTGGSGVIISHDGYIVTNHHVVNNATKMKVKLYDGRTFEAQLVGTDPATEVALVKIDASGLPSLPFGSSDDLRLGEWVLAIGSPFDLQSTITAGIVSAKGRNLQAINETNALESFIQTDAAVNPGNSGGALVNTKGELIGINTLIKTQTGAYMGYSFAIPSSIVQKVVTDLRQYGVVQRAMLGIRYTEVTQDFIDQFGKEYNITDLGGAAVMSIEKGAAADVAGIKVGDVITALDNTQIDSRNNLAEVMSRYKPNDKVKISVKREGKVKQFDVVLRNKAGKAELLSADHTDVAAALGGRFSEVSERNLKDLKIEHGIRVVEVRNGGIMARAKIRRDFIITHINERPIRSVGDLDKIDEVVTYIEGIYPNGQRMGYTIVQ